MVHLCSTRVHTLCKFCNQLFPFPRHRALIQYKNTLQFFQHKFIYIRQKQMNIRQVNAFLVSSCFSLCGIPGSMFHLRLNGTLHTEYIQPELTWNLLVLYHAYLPCSEHSGRCAELFTCTYLCSNGFSSLFVLVSWLAVFCLTLSSCWNKS